MNPNNSEREHTILPAFNPFLERHRGDVFLQAFRIFSYSDNVDSTLKTLGLCHPQ